MPFLARRTLCGIALLAIPAAAHPASAQTQQKHNVIIFVADGLRRGSVTAQDMPTFLKLQGVTYYDSACFIKQGAAKHCP